MELRHESLFEVKVRAARRWILPLLVIVVAIGLPAVWFGPRLFSKWQQQRLLHRASQGLRLGDVPNAAISLRRVLDLNPDNVEATRGMAELAETYLPREASALRERVCELVPTSYEDAKAWALTALKFGQAAQAEDAFELMKKTGQPSVAFHEIGGRVALDFGRLEEAREQFTQALALDSANESNQLVLAAIEIRLPDPAVKDGARQKLEGLRKNPKLRQKALRALVADRIDNQMIPEALALAEEFVNDPEATFQDRLQYLALLRVREDPSFQFTRSFSQKEGISFSLVPDSRVPTFSAYLNDLQAAARGNAGNVASLVDFLNTRGLSLLACEWTSTMAPEFVSAPPVALSLAEAYRLILDWQRLDELITGRDWGDMEFVRFAYCSRLAQAKGDRAGAAAHWATAVNLAEYRYERLAALARSASAWGWSNEFEEILWINARNSKRPRQALEELARFYREKRDAPKLLNVWTRLFELDPADLTAKKSWVRLSVLLNNERYRAGTIAQELYKEHADDPEIATSYALVLHFRQQDREGLAVMNRLSAEQLRTPSIAGYYAILLGGNKQREEAAKFLALAQEASWLPEERELLEQTRRALD